MIHTDSSYVFNCCTVWYKEWRQNNWKRMKRFASEEQREVKNRELIESIVGFLEKHENIKLRFINASDNKNSSEFRAN